MTLANTFTLVIPTFNRPVLLNGLLDYLNSKAANFSIAVLDSSSPDNKILNRRAIEKYGLRIRYLEFDESSPILNKINSCLSDVHTDYVSLCADDDIVFVDAIDDCLKELDAHHDIVGCHGTYLNFRLAPEKADLFIEYAAPSLDGDDLLARIYQLLSNYEAITYAIYRTEIIRRVLAASEQFSDSPFYWELYAAIATLAGGKIKRLARVSHARRSFVPAPVTQWHPIPLICENPDEFLLEFVHYRRKLFEFFRACGIVIEPDFAKQFSRAHLLYFMNTAGDGSWARELLARTFAEIGLPAINYVRPGGDHTERLKLGPGGVEFHLSESTKMIVPPDIAADMIKYCQVIEFSTNVGSP